MRTLEDFMFLPSGALVPRAPVWSEVWGRARGRSYVIVKAEFKFSTADLRVLSVPLQFRQTGSIPKPLPSLVSPESSRRKHKL